MNNELNNNFKSQNNNYSNMMNNSQNYPNQNSNQQYFNNSNQNNNGNAELNNNYYNLNGDNIYNNYNHQQIEQNNPPRNKQKNNKIIFIVLAIIVMAIVGIIIFGKSGSNEANGGNKNGDTVNVGEELEVTNNYTDIKLKVESIDRNVKLSSILGKLNNEVENFTKIKVTIINNRDKNTDIGTRNLFKLLDSNKQNVADGTGCLAKTWMGLYESVNDAIDNTLLAKSTTTGYIYCRDEGNEGTILQLTSITEFDQKLLEQGTIKSTDSDVFYVNLK